jgi:hypothetical protein
LAPATQQQQSQQKVFTTKSHALLASLTPSNRVSGYHSPLPYYLYKPNRRTARMDGFEFPEGNAVGEGLDMGMTAFNSHMGPQGTCCIVVSKQQLTMNRWNGRVDYNLA